VGSHAMQPYDMVDRCAFCRQHRLHELRAPAQGSTAADGDSRSLDERVGLECVATLVVGISWSLRHVLVAVSQQV
jgi:hypothetical protein